MERAASTACALTRVSKTFRAAVESAPEMFFEDVDLSHGVCAPTDARMRACAKRGVFKRTRRLNLSGCVRLTDATLRTLAETCESLEDVTLSGGSFTKDGIFAFIDAVRGLKAIHVDTSAPKMTPTDALGALQRFVERNAETLEKISCGREAPYAPAERRAFTKASNRLFDAIKKCTGLRVLNLTNCGEDVRFPLFELQRACPHLSELRLNHMGGEPGWRVVGRADDDFEDTCWRHLRVLEVAVSMETTSVGHRYGHSNVDDGVLVSMLYGSIETIEELDITGCTHLGDWRDVVWDRMPFQLKILQPHRRRLRPHPRPHRSRSSTPRPSRPRFGSLRLRRARADVWRALEVPRPPRARPRLLSRPSPRRATRLPRDVSSRERSRHRSRARRRRARRRRDGRVRWPTHQARAQPRHIKHTRCADVLVL